MFEFKCKCLSTIYIPYSTVTSIMNTNLSPVSLTFRPSIFTRGNDIQESYTWWSDRSILNAIHDDWIYRYFMYKYLIISSFLFFIFIGRKECKSVSSIRARDWRRTTTTISINSNKPRDTSNRKYDNQQLLFEAYNDLNDSYIPFSLAGSTFILSIASVPSAAFDVVLYDPTWSVTATIDSETS